MQDGNGRCRLRELGISIGALAPGPHNAITDVAGVEVGHTTLVEGEAVRTGVTAVWPHRDGVFRERVPCAVAVLNGTGEMTGHVQVAELGVLSTPILLTGTHSVGIVYDAVIAYMARRDPAVAREFVIPVVAETFDGCLSDPFGNHLKRRHVFSALDSASAGPVEEGSVGGGTGMICYQFKGGIGTASRRVSDYVVGVLAQCNFGRRRTLTVRGAPVGSVVTDLMPVIRDEAGRDGSVVLVVATDAPLLDRQLRRLCHRAFLGLARTGAESSDTSGDLAIAFSTANRVLHPRPEGLHRFDCVPDERTNGLFQATGEATEEAVINSMCAASTMTGRKGNKVYGLPLDRLADAVSRLTA